MSEKYIQLWVQKVQRSPNIENGALERSEHPKLLLRATRQRDVRTHGWGISAHQRTKQCFAQQNENSDFLCHLSRSWKVGIAVPRWLLSGTVYVLLPYSAIVERKRKTSTERAVCTCWKKPTKSVFSDTPSARKSSNGSF